MTLDRMCLEEYFVTSVKFTFLVSAYYHIVYCLGHHSPLLLNF